MHIYCSSCINKNTRYTKKVYYIIVGMRRFGVFVWFFWEIFFFLVFYEHLFYSNCHAWVIHLMITGLLVEEAVKQQVNTGLCSFKEGKRRKYPILNGSQFWIPSGCTSERAAGLAAVIVPSWSSHTNFFWNLTIRACFDTSLSANKKLKEIVSSILVYNFSPKLSRVLAYRE